ncbi:MAG TPA: glycoside hydrolase family 3 N-terminal domain-containing protein [Caproicibacter sp.]|nr:glycoside hydrolase family 3 N-terminal domain-containing protein [Caproicibacter sp.]
MKGSKNKKAKAAAAVGAVVFACAVLWGAFQFANVFLNKMFPPNGAKSGTVSSEPSSSQEESGDAAAASSAAASSGYSTKAAVNGIFSAYEDAAKEKLSRMTLKEKVGQVFIFECPEAGSIKTIDDYAPGGYCLMGRDFEGKSSSQVKKDLKAYQVSSKIPMILCCDEEGGTVVRVSSNRELAPKKFLSPQELFRQDGMNAITSDTIKKAQLLKSLGINVNLAPVCDVSTDPKNFIFSRSFGQNAQETSKFITVSVQAYDSEKMGCVLKHFPGYGSTGDTHTAAARDQRSFQTFEKSDFLPFQAGIKAGAACIMVSHCVVVSMDAERPASLSPQVHEILRKKLGFTGVVMTDSLAMGAVSAYTNGQNPVVEAFLAGNDMLLMPDISSSYKALYEAVQKGTVTEKRLDESVLRILAWKMELGLLS